MDTKKTTDFLVEGNITTNINFVVYLDFT